MKYGEIRQSKTIKLANDYIIYLGKNYRVSTIGLVSDDRVLFWETMVMPCDKNGFVISWGEDSIAYHVRYNNQNEALFGHRNILDRFERYDMIIDKDGCFR